MACPTCGHTMQLAGSTPGGRTLHLCPRCGTSRDGEGTVYVPALVNRCRNFQATLHTRAGRWVDFWTECGIAESINTPENRP